MLLAVLSAAPGAGPVGGPEKLATAAFAVARDPSGQKAAATVAAALSERAQRHPRLRVIEPGRALAGDPRTREEETLVRARTALADGRRAYDALSLDDAIARLGQAVTLYQQTGPLLGDLSELETALAYLGAALTLRGSADEGLSTFQELLTLEPGYAPDGLPPTVTRVFDQAVEKTNKQAKGTVEIYSTPPYASVYVDGTFRGVTPLTLRDMGAGTHYVRIEQSGYVVHGAPVEVTANQQVTSQTRLVSVKSGAELRDLLSRASREVLQPGMGTNLRALSRLLVADALVVISVSQSGNDVTLTGAVYDAVGATALATERAVVDAAGPTLYRDSGALADRLIAAAAGDAAVAAGGSGGGGIDDGDGTGSGFGLSTGAGVGGARAGGGASAGSSGGATAGSAGAQGGGTTPSTSGGSATPEAAPIIALAPRDGPTAGQIAGWTMVGVGGVGVIVGTVLAVLAKNTHADYRVTSQASVDLPTLRDDGKALALGADLGLFLGAGIGLGGAAVLLFASGSSDTPEELLQTALLPAFVPIDGGGAVVVRGSLP
jgi:hypothetical protein